jgi:hypothetical protein
LSRKFSFGASFPYVGHLHCGLPGVTASLTKDEASPDGRELRQAAGAAAPKGLKLPPTSAAIWMIVCEALMLTRKSRPKGFTG